MNSTFNEGVEAAAHILDKWSADYMQMAKQKTKESEGFPLNMGLGLEAAKLRAKAEVIANMSVLVRKEAKK